MVRSTFIVSVLGLLNLGANANVNRDQLRFSLTMDELNSIWEMNPPEFGSTPDDYDFAGSTRRRLAGQELEMPEQYYERCVFWINSARAREGLPALKRWRDFEPCSDRTAKYDNANGYHASVKRGLYCDWGNYMPIGQNTCPFMHKTDGSNRMNQDCTMSMWNEKSLLVEVEKEDGSTEARCENGGRAGNCAGHYLTLRGGEYGYNVYDRVACGFHLNGNEIWINQNFGSGLKTKLEALTPANKWTSPKNWVPSFEPWGFECGGDILNQPSSMLIQDCEVPLEELQYNDCAGVARQDYRWWGCAYRPAPVGCDHGLTHDATQLCETKPFDHGFGPTPHPVVVPSVAATPKPTVMTPKPTTPHPTNVCVKDEVAKKCKKSVGCMYVNKRRGCEARTVPCSDIAKKVCKNAHGCTWIQKGKNKGCVEEASSL